MFLLTRMKLLDQQTQWSEISLLLTNDTGIRPLKKAYFDLDEATDVLSVRYDLLPGETECTGEIIVNVQRAVDLGPTHGGSSHELALYLAHGCDHLCGEDDATEDGHKQMRQRELQWLKTAGDDGLIDGLIE